jgi:hypothetical protein
MKPPFIPSWVRAFSLGIVGVALLVVAVGGGFFLASPGKLDTPSLASFIDASQTVLYIRSTSTDIPKTLETINHFTVLPSLPSDFLPEEDSSVELVLVQNGWISRAEESGTGSVRFSSDDVRSAWLQEGYQDLHPFIASPLVYATLSSDEPNAIILMMSGSTLVSSGSLLDRIPEKPIAITSVWSETTGNVTFWKKEPSSRMRTTSVSDMALSTPFALIVSKPQETWANMQHLLDSLSPGLLSGIQGILDYQLLTQTDHHATLQDLSSLATNPLLLLLDNSGSSLTYAVGASPTDDVMTKVWSGAVLRASNGTVRTTPLLRDEIHRDIVESPVETTEKDEHGWMVRAIEHPVSPFFFASRANHRIVTNSSLLLSDATRILSTLSMISGDLLASFKTPWLRSTLQAHLPFLLEDPLFAPILAYLPESSRMQLRIQNTATLTSFSWNGTALPME